MLSKTNERNLFNTLLYKDFKTRKKMKKTTIFIPFLTNN